jgi:hypothetical protein
MTTAASMIAAYTQSTPVFAALADDGLSKLKTRGPFGEDDERFRMSDQFDSTTQLKTVCQRSSLGPNVLAETNGR